MPETILSLNKEGNTGEVKINWDTVKSYELYDRQTQSTLITFQDGTTQVLADTVAQIEVKLKWFFEGRLDKNGKLSNPKK